MSAPPKPKWTREDYDRDAAEYLASLPLEHFMESTDQATQRRVTVCSLQQLRVVRPRLRCFSELLIHWRTPEGTRHVVPDNMVVLGFFGDERMKSWPVELEPCEIFWVLEYVSESNRRKDYVDSFQKYEELKIPCYLVFDPEHQDLRLYRHNGSRYVPVAANEAGRLLLPEIAVEVAIQDGWVRYWHRGALLPITPEMQAQIARLSLERDEARQKQEAAEREAERLAKEKERAEKEKERAEKEKERAEKEKERAEKDNEALTKDKDRLQQQLSDQVALLRPLVEAKARQAGRQDVLEQLATTDSGQLTRWLVELS